MRLELTKEVSQEGRFAGTDFTGDDCESGIVHHAEFEHRKCKAVVLPPVDQLGIWEDRERLLLQPEMILELAVSWLS